MSQATQQFESAADSTQATAAKLLHPEDISVGDEITPAIWSYDYPSFFWCMADPAIMPPDETIRLSFLPSVANKPFKVVAVCLPFVLCEKVDGKFQTFDVRKVQLMRLNPDFAELARMGFATKKRKKVLEAEKLQQSEKVQQGPNASASDADADSFELGRGVSFSHPVAVDADPVTVDALAQIVLFEFTVQIPLADPEDVGGFFSVVVSQS